MSYRIQVSRAARRSLEEELPIAVALAAWEFILGPLSENPWRVGKPLRYDLAGLHSARRGAYRVIYRIQDETVTVDIIRIAHRGEAYR